MAPRTPTPPTLVLLVRHGHTPTTGRVLPGRRAGLHLSDKGHQQAATVAERLAAIRNIAAVYSSPLERTRQTAAPIAKALGLRVQIQAGLTECDFGSWTGKSLAALRRTAAWERVQRYPSGFRFPNGESFAEMQQRIVGTIQALTERHPGKTVVAVSHADPIKAAAAHALGAPLDLFQRIVISPCSVTAISYGLTGPAVLTVNCIGDLSSLNLS
ncbi:MAG: MSMEG_4193 family putative phosphomutase [Acidimicrobiales bacterium]|nr:MSMEG_4193 family putative phosphomutase [Acidimicrobiales bacterium]